jgi:NAD(P)-dependent dehydrogenase (short-subunit alcohol dehydrogenase family)
MTTSTLPPYGRSATATGVAADLSSNIANKVILTTGVSPGGTGAQFVEAIAVHKPKLLILAGRSKAKLEEEAKKIHSNPKSADTPTRLLILDLGSLKQVREAANEVLSYPENIDVLVNSAGVMSWPWTTTQDGIEWHFGTNHVAHFLFTNLIMPKLLATKTPRIVNVSSNGHRYGSISEDVNFNDGRDYDKWTAYGRSKTANILFSRYLAKKLGARGLQAYSLHPGVILGTSLAHSFDENDIREIKARDKELGEPFGEDDAVWDFKNTDEGAATHVVAAFDHRLKEYNGAYLDDANLAIPEVRKEGEIVRPHAWSDEETEKMWKLSEKLVGQTFEY